MGKLVHLVNPFHVLIEDESLYERQGFTLLLHTFQENDFDMVRGSMSI